VLLGSICVITLGVLTISSSTPRHDPYDPDRVPQPDPGAGRQVAVFFLLIFALSVVTTAVVGILQVTIVDAPSPSGEQWFRVTVGISL